jgi:hypothetical protein
LLSEMRLVNQLITISLLKSEGFLT